ncbi:hypothetical protein DL767_006884 [Monosporascus sp. MG133]|nr:hypothetical protein DL767_006884 [Monosporascus sp. MG133]
MIGITTDAFPSLPPVAKPRYSCTERSQHVISKESAGVVLRPERSPRRGRRGPPLCRPRLPDERRHGVQREKGRHSTFINAGVTPRGNPMSRRNTIGGLSWGQGMAEHVENGTRTVETSFLRGMPSSFDRNGARACVALFRNVTGVSADTDNRCSEMATACVGVLKERAGNLRL